VSASRRRVLKTIAGAAAGLALGARHLGASSLRRRPDIRHIVLVMMENRSFDHFLGWVPGADGEQAGLSYPDRSGQLQSPAPLAPDYQGCGHPDPDHSYDGGRVEYDGGACDGWLRAGANDSYAIGYYTEADLPFFSGAVHNWLTCDGYFAAIMSETFPNRVYQHAAQTDRLDNSLAVSTLPTIWDRLAEAGLDGRYYFTDLPIIALWGNKYAPISQPISQFFADCEAGTLPLVAFVDPKLLGENIGTSIDDHPYADIRNGQVFLNSIYNAIVQSPAWPQTILVISYDEWGGFFDHVPPAPAPVPLASRRAGDTDGLRGFRVPNFIISPWTPRGVVGHGLFDHTSVLRMIEWQWHLRPLTIRDATAANLADLLDFSTTNLDAPVFDVPAGPFGARCPLPAAPPSEWEGLRALAQQYGFIGR
jgi:phospholipase C